MTSKVCAHCRYWDWIDDDDGVCDVAIMSEGNPPLIMYVEMKAMETCEAWERRDD